jgi:hypothetical protein
MPYLVIFKRFEVWLLLCLLGGLFLYLIWPDGVVAASVGKSGPAIRAEAPSPEPFSEIAPPKMFLVTAVGRREAAGASPKQGVILDLTLFGRTTAEESVVLTEANLRIRDESGQTVPRFFEPFAPEASFVPNEDREARVALWWTGNGAKLWVEWEGEKVPVELRF